MMLLLVVLVALTGVASAQFVNPLACTANASSVPLVRAEGVAEEVGQVIIVCTGGSPTAVGQPIPTVNVQVFLNTNVTSRLVGTGSEALLLIDEPAPAIQTVCPAGTLCSINSANGNGTSNYTGGITNQNVWQASQASVNSVVWLGVPIDPPGTVGNRSIRLVNVRANASQLGVSQTLIPSSINMSITISGTGSLSLSNSFLTVAAVQPGMKFSASSGTFNQCEPQNWAPYYLRYSEQFATAFRKNTTLVEVTNQSTPGVIYNTESMFTNPIVGSVPAGAGVATQATRLIARFSNIPANVALRVHNSNTGTLSGGLPSDGTAWLVTGTDANGALGTLTNGIGTTNLTISGGGSLAVWEVQSANVAALGQLAFTAEINYGANPLPGLGTATVTGNYGPVSNVFTASATAPAPRFVDNPQSSTTFTITSCQTNLLFPYITSAPGFDTGIAISNTSSDPYGTSAQSGPCTLYYYGSTTGGGSAPASQTSGTVGAGTQLLFTLSNGGNLGIVSATDFTGYMIVRCNFQYAHGYAFISDLGIRNWAQGYVALVLDQNMFSTSSTVTRTGVKSEALDQ
jgi:hypothetical protein